MTRFVVVVVAAVVACVSECVLRGMAHPAALSHAKGERGARGKSTDYFTTRHAWLFPWLDELHSSVEILLLSPFLFSPLFSPRVREEEGRTFCSVFAPEFAPSTLQTRSAREREESPRPRQWCEREVVCACLSLFPQPGAGDDDDTHIPRNTNHATTSAATPSRRRRWGWSAS